MWLVIMPDLLILFFIDIAVTSKCLINHLQLGKVPETTSALEKIQIRYPFFPAGTKIQITG